MGTVLSLERQALDEAVEGMALIDVLARNARSCPVNMAIAWRANGASHQLTRGKYRLRAMAVADVN